MLKQPVRTNLSDFIKTSMGSQFVIPVYQRHYTWSPDKETARFMDDIEELLKGKSEHHFLGIIIYMETEIAAMFRQLQIVDGQQRLTTTFIFLLALKKLSEEKNDKNTAGMISDYYLYNRHSSKEASLRLKPAVDKDNVFERLVYGSEKDLNRKEKESAVYKNYVYIYQRLVNMMKNYSSLEVLDTLSRIDILAFPLSETDNVQQIFESINSTGAPLTSADLIRNYVLMNHPDAEQERLYHMYWEPLEDAYPQSRRLEDFFRYYLAAKTYDLLNRRDIYEGFKKYWHQNNDSDEDKLREIVRYNRYYHDVYEGPAENIEIENALKDFRLSSSYVPAPFLMEMMHQYDNQKISASEMVSVIRIIDSYLMRRALMGNDSGSLSRYFPSLLRTVLLSRKKNPKQDIISLTQYYLITCNRGRSLAMPTDEQLSMQLRECNAYALPSIRVVLDRIEHDHASAKVDTSDLNIEHIMPQHPNAWWRKNSGCADEDDYTVTANLIGNLTLCAQYDNTRMGNEDFAYKKKILSKTLHIRMNTEILKQKTWTKKSILKRCESMCEKIIHIYPYNGIGKVSRKKTAPPVNNEEIYTLNTPTVTARAILHTKENVEVMAGSFMKPYGNREMKKMSDLFHKFDSHGAFHEIDQNRVQLNQSIQFHDLNEAGQFLMHRGGDTSSFWKKEVPDTYWKNTQKQKKAVSFKKKTQKAKPVSKPQQTPGFVQFAGMNIQQPVKKKPHTRKKKH